jgi:hypothetical protein
VQITCVASLTQLGAIASMYYFSNHASGCETAEGAVFLDFRSGKYLGVPADHLTALRRCISGWPVPANTPSAASALLSAASLSILNELFQKGLLTQSPPELPTVQLQDVPTPTETLPDDLHDTAPVGFRLWLNFTLVLSIAYIWINLKLNRLDTLIRHIQSLKRQAEIHERLPEAARLRTIVPHFRRVSLWFYSRRDQCLFDSLVLTRFLYWHNIVPTLVFGVSTKPFAAHAWVQVSDVMLTDAVELALQTTPIFAA